MKFELSSEQFDSLDWQLYQDIRRYRGIVARGGDRLTGTKYLLKQLEELHTDLNKQAGRQRCGGGIS